MKNLSYQINQLLFLKVLQFYGSHFIDSNLRLRFYDGLTFFVLLVYGCLNLLRSSISFQKANKIEAIKIMISRIKQTSNLAEIYPDTNSELCNKHVKLLSSLKNTFEEIYDDMEPQRYVIVNGIAKVLDLGSEMQLSFALENGVTVLFKKTYENEDIYINSNHIEEEIIFNSHGKHIQGIHEKVDEIRDMIHIIRSHGTKDKPYFGAILYVHSNIGESLFAYQESFMLGVLLALLIVHDSFQKFSKTDILGILQTVDESLSPKMISNIIDQYQINRCSIESPKATTQPQIHLDLKLNDPLSDSDKSIGTHQSNGSIKSNEYASQMKSISDKELKKIQSNTTGSNNSISSLQEGSSIFKQEALPTKVVLDDSTKLIICRLDLSHEQMQDYEQKIRRIREVSDILQQEKSHILEDILSSHDQREISYIKENKSLLEAFMEGRIKFLDYIRQKHDLDIDYEIFDEEVVDIINEIKTQARFMKDFCVIQGTVLLISMQKQHYAEIMCFLRKLLNDYKLSTHHFLQTKHKFDEDKLNAQIGEIMFTSSASLGCAIFTSTEDAWI